MNITIIDGHPDPSEAHLNHALADRYARTAEAAGHSVRRIDVAKLDFPIMREPRDFYEGEASDIIGSAQVDIAWADHLVLFFPLWMSDVPAVLKAFFEQTFRPGFALDYGGPLGLPKRLLSHKSGRIVVTMGMPAIFYYNIMGAHAIRLLKKMFSFVGISPISETVIGGAMNPSERTKERWFATMDRIAIEDCERRPRRIAAAARLLVTGGIAAAGTYLAYAMASWARYGATPKAPSSDIVLDRFMPNYEVGLRHGTIVNAPASVTFSAIRLSDFERSPIVRILFNARDLLVRAKHQPQEPSSLPFDRLTSIGWGVLSIEPGREIVLGTVTKPWQSETRFRPIQGDEFASFNELGYAKIALSIRVDEVSSEHCEVRTETRVQTTDPISRARFRRYWAFLSPGMAMIRRALLQQIKSEAEAVWSEARPVTAASP